MNIFDAKQQFYLDLHFFSPVSEKYVIYFLLDNNEVVYVGKSSDDRYMGRIRKHRKDKLFDSYAVAATNLTERQCLEFETSLISLMQPKYNKKDSFFNLLRVVNGINTYYGANKLHSIPAKEQEDAAARSYLIASLLAGTIWAAFLLQSVLIVTFEVYNSMLGLCTMAAGLLAAVYGHIKKYKFKKIRKRNIQLGISN